MDIVLGNVWLLFFNLIILLPMLYSIFASDSRIWTYQSISIISVLFILVLNISSGLVTYYSESAFFKGFLVLLWQISLIVTTICVFYLVFNELKEKYLRYQVNNDWLYGIPGFIEIAVLIVLALFSADKRYSDLISSIASVSIYVVINFYILLGAFLCYKSSLYNLDFDIKYIARKHLYYYTVLCIAFLIEQVVFSNAAVGTSYVVFLLFNYMTKSKTMISQDSLSGVNNRVSFNKYINNVFLSKDHDGAYIVYIDIDKFKQINDTYGHIEGDEAISLVGKTLKSIAGETNSFVARIGGDEFVMIVKTTEEEKVKKVIQNISFELEERIIFSDKQYDLTVSCGYIEVKKNQKNIKELMVKADESMYIEKLKKSSEVADGAV
ncbi:GGDEF domain-containing protein [Succinivibrio faecicola]|uniref:diguanylate cyclase n=1 Tax=Succinivibrio faecicola TaxID=2820300 RepID=A0ABS7DGX4_9GAMM|nr:GGDEF domain-containing protein [Succinivibrio faecicola]MBW7570552.1 GGDEF domain-containing protein [Succinivibrio faecicola]